MGFYRFWNGNSCLLLLLLLKEICVRAKGCEEQLGSSERYTRRGSRGIRGEVSVWPLDALDLGFSIFPACFIWRDSHIGE